MRAEIFPVVSPAREQILGARAFYAAAVAEPYKLTRFMAKVYELRHVQNMPLGQARIWQESARSVGVRGFAEAWDKLPAQLVQESIEKLANYQISVTPSVAIAGRYVVTPDNTNGNAELFYQLLNGMVSKHLQQPA